MAVGGWPFSVRCSLFAVRRLPFAVGDGRWQVALLGSPFAAHVCVICLFVAISSLFYSPSQAVQTPLSLAEQYYEVMMQSFHHYHGLGIDTLDWKFIDYVYGPSRGSLSRKSAIAQNLPLPTRDLTDLDREHRAFVGIRVMINRFRSGNPQMEIVTDVDQQFPFINTSETQLIFLRFNDGRICLVKSDRPLKPKGQFSMTADAACFDRTHQFFELILMGQENAPSG